MKTKLFTLFAILLLSLGNTQAQFYLEENFDYAPGPLIQNPIASSDNINLTGWLTMSNSSAATNAFDVASAPLTYNGYASSGIGNALTYNGNAGQSIFRPWGKVIKNDSTAYIAFLLNIPKAQISGGDFFFGIKMEVSATSTNWGSCIYAQVDTTFAKQEITFSIKKASSGTASPSMTYFAAGTTHLMVLKYKVGILNGTTAAGETGLYDDQMSLFIDPPLTGTEPSTPTIYCADANQKDLYRYGATKPFGGAAAVYLRSSATGNAPAYTIDGIRVGLTWADVLTVANGLKKTTADNFSYAVNNKRLILNTSATDYTTYNIVSLSGQKVLTGSLQSQHNTIDASTLQSGVYILNLQGKSRASAKVMIK